MHLNWIQSLLGPGEVKPCSKHAFYLPFANTTSCILFLGVISLTSNIVVLLMFVKFKELRTATNFIIINLAFTDIGVAGIGYPMSAASDIHGSWKFGYTGCQVGGMWSAFYWLNNIHKHMTILYTIWNVEIRNFVSPVILYGF